MERVHRASGRLSLITTWATRKSGKEAKAPVKIESNPRVRRRKEGKWVWTVPLLCFLPSAPDQRLFRLPQAPTDTMAAAPLNRWDRGAASTEQQWAEERRLLGSPTQPQRLLLSDTHTEEEEEEEEEEEDGASSSGVQCLLPGQSGLQRDPEVLRGGAGQDQQVPQRAHQRWQQCHHCDQGWASFHPTSLGFLIWAAAGFARRVCAVVWWGGQHQWALCMSPCGRWRGSFREVPVVLPWDQAKQAGLKSWSWCRCAGCTTQQLSPPAVTIPLHVLPPPPPP